MKVCSLYDSMCKYVILIIICLMSVIMGVGLKGVWFGCGQVL